ncbi:MAG: hypothetical protein HFH58_02770 [Lachnospiraceae bacterium]|jgi:hypothetical protein|nr:hypothetical protein [Lachnospiraceae bacterium]
MKDLTKSLDESMCKYYNRIPDGEQRAFQIMVSDRVQQMVDNITLFNTVLEKGIEKAM